jgi:hypothetical protein
METVFTFPDLQVFSCLPTHACNHTIRVFCEMHHAQLNKSILIPNLFDTVWHWGSVCHMLVPVHQRSICWYCLIWEHFIERLKHRCNFKICQAQNNPLPVALRTVTGFIGLSVTCNSRLHFTDHYHTQTCFFSYIVSNIWDPMADHQLWFFQLSQDSRIASDPCYSSPNTNCIENTLSFVVSSCWVGLCWGLHYCCI